MASGIKFYFHAAIFAAVLVSFFATSTFSAYAITGKITGFTVPQGITISPNGAYAYVSDLNSIYKLNLSTYAITGKIPDYSMPLGVAFSPNGTYAYAANWNNNTVSVIDTATDSIIQTFSGFDGAESVAFYPKGPYLYVTNLNNGKVSFVNIATGSISNITYTAQAPAYIAFSPNGLYAYIISNSTTVTILNMLKNAAQVGTISGLNNPIAVTFSPDGKYAYIANSGSNISVVNTSTSKIIGNMSGFHNPASIAISPNGLYAYVVNTYNDNNISIVSLSPSSSSLPLQVYTVSPSSFYSASSVPSVTTTVPFQVWVVSTTPTSATVSWSQINNLQCPKFEGTYVADLFQGSSELQNNYAGSGTSYTYLNLSRDQTYNALVYAWCGSGVPSCASNSITFTTPEGTTITTSTTTTISATSTVPFQVWVVSTTPTSATVAWTQVNSLQCPAFQGWYVADLSTSSGEIQNNYGSYGSSYTYKGLSPGKTYNALVYAWCGSGVPSCASNSISFNTPAAPAGKATSAKTTASSANAQHSTSTYSLSMILGVIIALIVAVAIILWVWFGNKGNGEGAEPHAKYNVPEVAVPKMPDVKLKNDGQVSSPDSKGK